MTFSTDALLAATAVVCARHGVDVSGLPAPELLGLSDDIGRLRRDADVLMAQVAAEIDRRSQAADAGAGLAARHGFRSAGELIARATGGSIAEANRLLGAGGLLADAEELALSVTSPFADAEALALGVTSPLADAEGLAFGVTSPPAPTPVALFRRDLAALVREGRIGVDAAAAFSAALEGLPDTERTRELFSKALAQAPGFPCTRFANSSGGRRRSPTSPHGNAARNASTRTAP
jgi:hypothetical protein